MELKNCRLKEELDIMCNRAITADQNLQAAKDAMFNELNKEFTDLSDSETDPQILKTRFASLAKCGAILDVERMALTAQLNTYNRRLEEKWKTKYHDLTQVQGAHLKLLGYRGKKSLWPGNSLSVWNSGGEAIRTVFPGWIPLPVSEEGSQGIPAQFLWTTCSICLNHFGPEGGYLSATCGHAIHVGYLLRLLHPSPRCAL
ncbi:hypothetical protein R1flu_024996 [Riccia fluitans]|uniref:Uncharacterized protein n=1 Tax=Riccia fluitans TaxID=41844 RepID=A0ABD1XWY7_9MARC